MSLELDGTFEAFEPKVLSTYINITASYSSGTVLAYALTSTKKRIVLMLQFLHVAFQNFTVDCRRTKVCSLNSFSFPLASIVPRTASSSGIGCLFGAFNSVAAQKHRRREREHMRTRPSLLASLTRCHNTRWTLVLRWACSRCPFRMRCVIPRTHVGHVGGCWL